MYDNIMYENMITKHPICSTGCQNKESNKTARIYISLSIALCVMTTIHDRA